MLHRQALHAAIAQGAPEGLAVFLTAQGGQQLAMRVKMADIRGAQQQVMEADASTDGLACPTCRRHPRQGLRTAEARKMHPSAGEGGNAQVSLHSDIFGRLRTTR